MRTDVDGPSGLPLTRTEASGSVEAIGWRYLLGALCASVPVSSLKAASTVALVAIEAAGTDVDALALNLRPDRVELRIQSPSLLAVTAREVEIVRRIDGSLRDLGLKVAPARSDQYPHPVTMLEIAIDSLDIAAIRPFWQAALAYIDDPRDPPTTGALVDPVGMGPSVWFQQMDQPRPQRNRIHLDIIVPHDEAELRVSAVLAAGGHLVSDAHARSFWVLADAEGNECCICTWLDRDPVDAADHSQAPSSGSPPK